MNADVTLFFGNKAIGTVKEPFLSDDTWYGTIQLGIDSESDEVERRLINYIRFVEDWNERVQSAKNASPDEFDAYADLTSSGRWFTKDTNGEITVIIEAPVFFCGGEVSWRTSGAR